MASHLFPLGTFFPARYDPSGLLRLVGTDHFELHSLVLLGNEVHGLCGDQTSSPRSSFQLMCLLGEAHRQRKTSLNKNTSLSAGLNFILPMIYPQGKIKAP